RGEGAATVTSWRAGPRGTSRCASVEAQVFVESASESTSGASITVPGYALGARILRRRGRSRRRRRTEPAGAAVHDPRPPRDGGRPSLLVPAGLPRGAGRAAAAADRLLGLRRPPPARRARRPRPRRPRARDGLPSPVRHTVPAAACGAGRPLSRQRRRVDG